MHYQGEERARLRRQRSKEAITLAMQSRWEEAAAVNRIILESFPTDVDAYNRLGRALMAQGEYTEATEAYSRALELDSSNNIAKKNLRRLSHLEETQSPSNQDKHKAVPQSFIEETGKSGILSLEKLAPEKTLAKMVAGDQVYLKVQGQYLIAENKLGEYLGEVESKYGRRLAKLIEGGNDYTAAITSLSENEVRVIIGEIFKHPNQAGNVSFPLRGVEGFRPYIKELMLKYEADTEEESSDEYPFEADEEGEPSTEMVLFDDAVSDQTD